MPKFKQQNLITCHPELTYGVAEENPKLTATAFACEVDSGSYQLNTTDR